VLYLLDGTVVNNHSAAPSECTATILGVEGILEFRYLLIFHAEYGRVGGGVMSMVTRSGTTNSRQCL